MKKKRSRLGFTLVEVMVAAGVVFLCVPSVLMFALFMTRSANAGIEHNESLSKSRYFQQVFSRHINASQNKLTPVSGSANYILFTQYDEDAKRWVDASMGYSKTDNNIVYTPDISMTNGQKVLIHEVYPSALNSAVFSVSNGNVTCALWIGNQRRVELDISATARNQ